MLDELKTFCKNMKICDKKKDEHKAKIAELEGFIKPYLLQIQNESAEIKKIRKTQTMLEEKAYSNGLLTCNLMDVIQSFCKLTNLTTKDLSVYITVSKLHSKAHIEDFLSEIKQNPKSGFLKLTIRTRKDSSQDFIYVLDFPIEPERKFADGTSIFDNLISKTNKQGESQLAVKPQSAHNLILNFQPYQTAKQQPWTPLRKEELLYKAVINSAIKYWSKNPVKDDEKLK